MLSFVLSISVLLNARKKNSSDIDPSCGSFGRTRPQNAPRPPSPSRISFSGAQPRCLPNRRWLFCFLFFVLFDLRL